MDKTLLSTFRGKKILITGSTGFKGSWLSIWLNNNWVLQFTATHLNHFQKRQLCCFEYFRSH